jgi:hypothetical protein
MACEEMQLFYAYLDAVEETKRKAQPWECEVTIIPQGNEAATAAPQAAPKPAPKPAPATGSFACDDVSDAIADQPPPLLGKP